MKRVAFLIDGLNVYHSIREAERMMARPLSWLDLSGLCDSYVHSGLFGRDATLGSVTYFTAIATHLGPSSVQPQQTYLKALRATGVEVVLGHFKARSRQCARCGASYRAFEEKETDVAIAVRLLECAVVRAADPIVVISGDSDILPAVRGARRLNAMVWIASPFARYHRALGTELPHGFKIHAKAYLRHQLPNSVRVTDGTMIRRPQGW